MEEDIVKKCLCPFCNKHLGSCMEIESHMVGSIKSYKCKNYERTEETKIIEQEFDYVIKSDKEVFLC
jgi:hypothetical protein